MKKILKFIPLTITVTAVIAFVYYSVRNLEKTLIENSLMKIEPIFLAVTFIGIISFIFLNRKDIISFFRKIPKTTWLLLFGIFILALILRAAITPATHRVYFDEDIYLDIGKEILLRGNGSLCNYGDTECHEYAFMKWPNAYPTILAGSYAIFGISEAVAFNLVILLGSLSLILIFLLAYVLTENHKISIYASLIFALIPVHIMWSATTASEPVLVFFTLLAFTFLALAIKINSWKMHLLALLSLAFAIQVRTEGIILLPIFGFMILILDKHRWKKFTEKKFFIPWIIFFIIITPYLMHVYHSSRIENWGASGPAFAFSYLDKNIPENGQFWFGGGYPNIEHPVFYTALGIIGIILVFALKNNSKKSLDYFLILWFFLLFMLYAFFYAGSVKFGTDVRYTLSGYVPLTILAAIGIYGLSTIKKNYEKYVALLIIAAIFISFYVFYLPTVATPADKIEEAKQARAYHKFVLEEVRKLPEDCYILAHTPSIYLTEGRNSLQTWYGQNYDVMNELLQKGCVVFDQNVWCNYVPEDSLCHYILDNYNLQKINSISIHGHTYTMHYVLGRK